MDFSVPSNKEANTIEIQGLVPKYINDSADFLTEIIGQSSLYGTPMAPGEILDIVDILAGRIAFRHSNSNIATVAFDRVDFHGPIYHQDLIQAKGHILSVGRSSMVIKIAVYRFDIQSRTFEMVQSSWVTMVAILKQGVPNKNIPQLIYTEQEVKFEKEAEERKNLTAQWLKDQTSNLNSVLIASQIQTDHNKSKKDFLSIPETELIIRHAFMPRDLNMNSTVFGGAVLLLMHRVAIQCSRAFTKNPNMVTLTMNRISFKKPIFPRDFVEMISRVVYVNDTFLEVEIEVSVTRFDTQESFMSHNGYFSISSRDKNGALQKITTGLKLDDEDQISLHRFHKAKLRQQFFEPC